MATKRLQELRRRIGVGQPEAKALIEFCRDAGDDIDRAAVALADRHPLPASFVVADATARQIWREWLAEALSGSWDARYLRRRRTIARRHAQLGLGQELMCAVVASAEDELIALAERVHARSAGKRRAAHTAIRAACRLDRTILLDRYYRYRFARTRTMQSQARRRLEAEVAAHQSFANTLLDNAAVGVMAVDRHGKLTHTNRKMQQLLGYSTEELADRRRWLLAAFPDPQDHQEAELYFGAVATDSPPEGRTLLTVRCKDGSQRVLEFWSTPLLVEAQHHGAVTIAFDVTDRQRLEQQLIRAERLAAIGELAASLAHEVRNPLAGIMGAIQVMRSQMPTEDSRRDVLEEVLHQMGRLDSTMRDLLIYSRPKPLEPRRCRIEQVVDRVLTVVAAEPGFRRMQIIKNYNTEMPEIELDPDQMEQVCMNIVLNGAQAMESGGRITIASHADNSQVVLSFTDDGTGMSPFQVRRAFEPFFTTKSRGTGLGLCICKRIVEAHGGSIRLDSRPGEGTCVTISLPTQFVGVGRSQRRTESSADPDAP